MEISTVLENWSTLADDGRPKKGGRKMLSLRENIKLKSDCMSLCKSENNIEMAKYVFDVLEENNASIQYTSILYQILYDDFDDICMNYDGFVDFVASFQEKGSS